MSTYNVAIVGAGPAGYFSAQALQGLSNNQLTFKVDLFERLPTPWGLVRSGVAPDHQKIKSVSKVFEKISDNQNFRLFANVEVGRDVSLDALKSAYDAVILAVGTPLGKRLGIPGEDLLNCGRQRNLFLGITVILTTVMLVLIFQGSEPSLLGQEMLRWMSRVCWP